MLGVFLGVKITVELVCEMLALTMAAIAAVKITQQVIANLAEHLDIKIEEARRLIENAKSKADDKDTEETTQSNKKYKQPSSGKSGIDFAKRLMN